MAEAEKYLMFSLEGEESKKLAEILGNDTCKKILNLLAEKEASETDIARELHIPVNTAEYNLKKLIQVGLAEKTKSFFWSQKGKKIPTYKAARKQIIITPRSTKTIVNIFIVAVLSVIAAYFVKLYTSGREVIQKSTENVAPLMEKTATGVPEALSGAASFVSSNPVWPWFLAGALFALLLVIILNWKKL